jgi:hypothetical protein
MNQTHRIFWEFVQARSEVIAEATGPELPPLRMEPTLHNIMMRATANMGYKLSLAVGRMKTLERERDELQRSVLEKDQEIERLKAKTEEQAHETENSSEKQSELILAMKQEIEELKEQSFERRDDCQQQLILEKNQEINKVKTKKEQPDNLVDEKAKRSLNRKENCTAELKEWMQEMSQKIKELAAETKEPRYNFLTSGDHTENNISEGGGVVAMAIARPAHGNNVKGMVNIELLSSQQCATQCADDEYYVSSIAEESASSNPSRRYNGSQLLSSQCPDNDYCVSSISEKSASSNPPRRYKGSRKRKLSPPKNTDKSSTTTSRSSRHDSNSTTSSASREVDTDPNEQLDPVRVTEVHNEDLIDDNFCYAKRSIVVFPTCRPDLELAWARNLRKLEAYKAQHGTCNVPQQDKNGNKYTLGNWVTNQRNQYKRRSDGKSSSMTLERQGRLEKLGFVWKINATDEWSARLAELEAYKAKYGDCLVSQRYPDNPQLGRWVANTRQLDRKNDTRRLTPSRRQKLDALGFCWDARIAARSGSACTRDGTEWE